MLDAIRAKGFEVGFFNDGVFVCPESKLTPEQKRWVASHQKELYAELWKETSPENRKSVTETNNIMLTHGRK